MRAGGAGSSGKTGRRRIKIAILAVILLALLAAGLYFGYKFLEDREANKWAAQLEEATDRLAENKKFVYVAARDIRAGETINDTNVELQTVYSSMDVNLFAEEDDLGKRAKVDIAAGTQLVKDFFLEKEFGAADRAVEYKFIYCGGQIAEGDFVDVRIVYPDGTDYIILSKKCVEGIGEGDDTSVVLWCDEEEMLLMSSAVVDAFIYSLEEYSVKKNDKYIPSRTSRIYAVKYVEPTLQDPSTPAYVPSAATMKEIAEDPNIVEAASAFLSEQVRAEYEERLFKYMSGETLNTLGLDEETYSNWQDYISGGNNGSNGANSGGRSQNQGNNNDDDLMGGYDPNGN